MIILPIKYPKLTSVFQSHLRRALLRGHHLPGDALGHPGFTRYNAREVSRGLRCHCGTGYDRVVSKASATPLRDTLPPLTHLAHGQITFRPSSMTSASSNASLLSAVSTRPITVPSKTHHSDTFSARMVRVPRRPHGHSRPGECTHMMNEVPSLTPPPDVLRGALCAHQQEQQVCSLHRCFLDVSDSLTVCHRPAHC